MAIKVSNQQLIDLNCSELTIHEIIKAIDFKGHPNTIRYALKRLGLSYQKESKIMLGLQKILATGDTLENNSPKTILAKLKNVGVKCQINALREHLDRLNIKFVQSHKEEHLKLIEELKQDTNLINLTLEDIMNKYKFTYSRHYARDLLSFHNIHYAKTSFSKIKIFFNEEELLNQLNKLDTTFMSREEIHKAIGFKANLKSLTYFLKKHDIAYLKGITKIEAQNIEQLISQNSETLTLTDIRKKINFSGETRDLKHFLIQRHYSYSHNTIDNSIIDFVSQLDKNQIYLLSDIIKLTHFVGSDTTLLNYLTKHDIKVKK